MIWRRLLVRVEASVAESHAVLRIAFGWTDAHLHRFVIHGREYGITYLGGLGFRDDAREIRLSGFGFRVGDGSSTTTTSPTAGGTICVSPSMAGSTRAAPGVAAPVHRRTAVDPGPCWSRGRSRAPWRSGWCSVRETGRCGCELVGVHDAGPPADTALGAGCGESAHRTLMNDVSFKLCERGHYRGEELALPGRGIRCRRGSR